MRPRAVCPPRGTVRGPRRAGPELRRAPWGRPTFTLLKSSCVCSVYICSVRSILWAPSLQAFTSLLMAFSARLAALCLSGWPWALRQSVCRDDARREPRQGPICTPGFEARTGRGPSPTPDPGGAAARLRLDPRGLCRARLVGGNRERAAPRAPPLPVLGHLCPAREGPAASSSTPPRGPRRVRCPFWLGQLTHPAQATCCLRELSGAPPRVCTVCAVWSFHPRPPLGPMSWQLRHKPLQGAPPSPSLCPEQLAGAAGSEAAAAQDPGSAGVWVMPGQGRAQL